MDITCKTKDTYAAYQQKSILESRHIISNMKHINIWIRNNLFNKRHSGSMFSSKLKERVNPYTTQNVQHVTQIWHEKHKQDTHT